MGRAGQAPNPSLLGSWQIMRHLLSRYPLLSGEALRQREAGRVEVLQQLLLLGLGARLQEPAPAVLVAHVLLMYARRKSPHNSVCARLRRLGDVL